VCVDVKLQVDRHTDVCAVCVIAMCVLDASCGYVCASCVIQTCVVDVSRDIQTCALYVSRDIGTCVLNVSRDIQTCVVYVSRDLIRQTVTRMSIDLQLRACAIQANA